MDLNMIEITNVSVVGWKPAIRGARNPLNSWNRMDSVFGENGELIVLGENDKSLLSRLANAGSDHGKFMRMIVVYLDINAPLYWWKEFDTYKVGTVANSCSTMHKIHAKEFCINDFSYDQLNSNSIMLLQDVVKLLNSYRDSFIETKNKDYWWQLIQLLPSSYEQKRTVMLNYEVLKNMYKARKNHKLDEWHDFCAWIETLPHSYLITGKKEEECNE